MVVGDKTILKLSCSGPFGLGQEIPQLDPRSGPTRLWLYMGMGELEMNKTQAMLTLIAVTLGYSVMCGSQTSKTLLHS